MDDKPPVPLTSAERAAGYRWLRLGTGWFKLEPGEKTAKEYRDEHRARVAAVESNVRKSRS